MDKINFLAKDDFPGSSDTLNRLQEATSMVSILALLGGSNYILSGCDKKNGKIEPGVIVLGGEILPFLGGDPLEFVFVQETKKTLEAFDELYPEAYIDRVAVFAADGKFKWDDLKQILTNQQIENKINSLKGEDPGFVKKWSGLVERLDTSQYLLCDGRTVNTIDYPDLAWFYGKEKEVSFKLPDLRKRFIVGYDGIEGSDYGAIGNIGGEEFHALTEDENGEHNHIMPWGENVNQDWNPPWGYAQEYLTGRRGSNGNDSDNAWAWSSPSGKGKPHENRPLFYTLAYVVRVKY